MCEYLDQVGSTYYIRRAVPLDLRGRFVTKSGATRTEWKESLGTKDRATAKHRLHVRALELDREIEVERARLASPENGEGRLRRGKSRSQPLT